MTDTRTVKCPQCGAAVPWTSASRWRPFCSERCKTLDLGAWASEAYRVPAVEQDDDPSPDASTGDEAPDR
jgi:endogenous inhibitor of DNA gyrase (YacG/DUF329 family)